MKKLLYKIPAILLLSCLISFSACKNGDTATKATGAEEVGNRTAEENNYLIRFERTACLGYCPSYSAEITTTGDVLYNGRVHVPVTGQHRFSLEPEVMHQVRQRIRKMNFRELENEYRSQATDIPAAIITLNEGGNKKTVIHEEGGPVALIDLNNYLHKELMAALNKSFTRDGKMLVPTRRSEELPKN